MDMAGMRRKKPSAWARVKAALAVGFTPVVDEVTKRRQALSTHIQQVRAEIFRARPTCQLCLGTRSKDCYGLPDQMHEDPPRSETRGRAPEERFNASVCARLCAACHRDVTEKKIRLVKLTPAGFAGPIRVEQFDTGERV